MGRIGDLDAFMSFFCIEGDRGVVVYGEAYLSVVPDDNNAVFFCRFVSDEAPGPTARQPVEKFKAGAYCVFCLVESTSVVAEAVCFGNRPEQPL